MFLTAIYECRLICDCKYLLSKVLKNVSQKVENFCLGTLPLHSTKDTVPLSDYGTVRESKKE